MNARQNKTKSVFQPFCHGSTSQPSLHPACGHILSHRSTLAKDSGYQEQGLNCFDFGGWYYGTDPAMQRINDFKRGFGGEVRREYWCETVLTLKGRVVLAVAGVLNWARRLHRTSGRNTPKGATEVDSIPSIAPVDAG